jgi:gliding motility-associated-like protein
MKAWFFLVFCLLCFSSHLFAQNESRHWYFGSQAGLRFADTGLEVLQDGAMVADEGCATVSDSHGNLLFYTNGRMVWNRHHQLMPNGFGLFGHLSATQSSLIVRQPGSASIWYVFTVVDVGKSDGFRYSKVDMTADGGLGDVVKEAKNIPLTTPVTEKLSATYHSNGRDVWILVHAWNSADFLAYLLTDTGIVLTPVTSTVGLIHGGNASNAIGQMTFSLDGSKLLLAIYADWMVQYFDFDKETGHVKNPFTFPTHIRAYGCEFSPDGSKIYIGSWGGSLGGSTIFQYDIQSGDSMTTVNSRHLISPQNNIQFGSFQLGIDGKIYVAVNNSLYLSCIRNPNESAPFCDFRMDDIHLSGRMSKGGLPNLLKRVHVVKPDFEVQGHCMNDPICFFTPPFLEYDSLEWHFGDGSQRLMTFETNVCHSFSDTGLITVIMKRWLEGEYLEVQKYVAVYASSVLKRHVSICQGEEYFYRGQIVSVSGVYSDTFFNAAENGCDSIVETHVFVQTPVRREQFFEGCEGLEIAVGSTIYNQTGVYYDIMGECDTLVTYLNIYSLPLFHLLSVEDTCNRHLGSIRVSHITGSPPYQYFWNTGSMSSVLEGVEAGSYQLQVTDQRGCVGSDSVEVGNLEMRCWANFFVPQSFSPNGDGLNDVFELVSPPLDWIDVCIYNRWGELVFRSQDPDFKWDGGFLGKECPTGIYSVVIVYALDRSVRDAFTYRGTLHLLR